MDAVGEKYKINHGANIRSIRCSKQLGQDVIAGKLGITEDDLCNYENRELLDEEVLTGFAEALDIPIEVLKYMPSEDHSKVQIFKDVNFTNSSVGLSHNSFTSYYNDPEVIQILKDNIELLKSRNKFLEDKLSYFEQQ